MITLPLTLSESEQLRTLLAQQTQSEFAPLLRKLEQAKQQATRQRTCSVCQSPFIQLNSGRNANYCSNACKQKAYRQRCRQAKRHFPCTPTAS